MPSGLNRTCDPNSPDESRCGDEQRWHDRQRRCAAEPNDQDDSRHGFGYNNDECESGEGAWRDAPLRRYVHHQHTFLVISTVRLGVMRLPDSTPGAAVSERNDIAPTVPALLECFS